MTKFTVEKQIDSHYVTKDLLNLIENYLISTIPEMTQIPEDLIRESYSVLITDNLGIEEMSSITNYSPALFPDSTREILVRLNSRYPKECGVSIRFINDKTLAKISIACESVNSREIVLGIYEGIRRIMEPQKNINRIFHPTPIVQGVIEGLGAIPFLSGLILFLTKHYSLSLISALVFIVIMGYSSFGKKLKPYISFETKYYITLKKWSDWFIYGLLGFIIFGTLLVMLRHIILGF